LATSAARSSVRTRGVRVEKLAQRLQPRRHRHEQIQQQDVGTQLADHPDGVATVARFADHPQLRIGLEQRPQRVTENRMIIRDKYGNWCRRSCSLLVSRPCSLPRLAVRSVLNRTFESNRLR
jgi:lantibiotic modifying enzyme